MTALRDGWAVFTLVLAYYGTVARHVRRQLDVWRARAAQISDPDLRRFALDKLAGEHLNAEAAAVFATLVPWGHRADAAQLMVTFEVMYDFLDAVSEEPSDDPVRNGLTLHHALDAVVLEREPRRCDFYAASRHTHDGGYLDELIASCRTTLATLPAVDIVRPALVRSATRCGEGQTRTHAVEQVGASQLRTWACRLEPNTYSWWERAAGSASSLALHALFAAAGDDSTTGDAATGIEHAYFPSSCALSTLLDALIDQSADAARGSHNYLDYYATPPAAVERLRWIACDAAASSRTLRRGRRHAAIAAGVSAFYLSAQDGTRGGVAAIIASLPSGTIRPLMACVRCKRWLEGG